MRTALHIIALCTLLPALASWAEQKPEDSIDDFMDTLQEINGGKDPGCPEITPNPIVKQELFPECAILANLPDGPRKAENCNEAFRSIPNKEALRYTLQYFVKNQGEIKDPRCFLDHRELDQKAKVDSKKWKNLSKEAGFSTVRLEVIGRQNWVDMAKARGVELKDLKTDIVNRGIENGCQFMLNDYSTACAPEGGSQAGYWVDLCGPPGSVVRKMEVLKRGVGTCAHHFKDSRDLETTVAGAMLSGAESVHTPYRWTPAYRDLQKRNRLQKVLVFGMNESNNDTFWDKHIHISPYETSNGCPALNEIDLDVIQKMGQSQTLIMNYGPSHFHQNVDNCLNGDGGGEN